MAPTHHTGEREPAGAWDNRRQGGCGRETPQGAFQVYWQGERKPRGFLAYLGTAGSQEEAGIREEKKRQKGTSWMETVRLWALRG